MKTSFFFVTLIILDEITGEELRHVRYQGWRREPAVGQEKRSAISV
jgi:hypothetical protein